MSFEYSILLLAEYSRNSKTQTTNDTTLADEDEGPGESSHVTFNKAEYVDILNHGDKEKELQYVEKVMVSVHRDASDAIKSLVQDSAKKFNLESRDLQSLPASTPLQDVQSSPSENNSNFVNGKLSEQTSTPASTPFQCIQPGSGKENRKLSWTTQDTKVAHLGYERNSGNITSKYDESRVLNQETNSDWDHVVKELHTRDKSTKTFSEEKVKNKDSGDDLQQFLEELADLDTSKQLQAKDMSTSIEDDKTESSHGYSFRSHSNKTANASNAVHGRSKSLEVVVGQSFEILTNLEGID